MSLLIIVVCYELSCSYHTAVSMNADPASHSAEKLTEGSEIHPKCCKAISVILCMLNNDIPACFAFAYLILTACCCYIMTFVLDAWV